MLQKIFAIYDVKAEAFMQPFFAHTTGQAVRSFTDAIANPESPFAKHPEDYSLFHIGSYNDQSARLEPETAPVPIGAALEFMTIK